MATGIEDDLARDHRDERQDRSDTEQDRRAARQGSGPIGRDREQHRSDERHQDSEGPEVPEPILAERRADEPDRRR